MFQDIKQKEKLIPTHKAFIYTQKQERLQWVHLLHRAGVFRHAAETTCVESKATLLTGSSKQNTTAWRVSASDAAVKRSGQNWPWPMDPSCLVQAGGAL